MKKLILSLFLASALAFGQGVRAGDQSPVTQLVTSVGTQFYAVQPGATISFCNAPANGVPCTNKATTYTDSTLGTPCPTSTQITLVGSTSCVANPDADGRWGVWAAPGQYEYTVTTSAGSFGPYPVTLPPPNGGTATFSGLTVTGSTNTKRLDGIRYADQFFGADLGAKINAAAADCGGGCTVYIGTNGTISTALSLPINTELVFRPGTWHWSGAQAINTSFTTIRGAGPGLTTFYLDSATSDMFDVTGYGFTLKDVFILPNVTRTAGSIINSTSTGAGGYVYNVSVQDGYRFLTMSSGGGWFIDKVSTFSAGGNWNYLIKTYVASGTTAGLYISNYTADIRSANQTDAAFIFDSRTDTVKMTNIDILTSTTTPQPAIKTQDTDSVGGFPRWIFCTHCSVESPGAYGLYIDKGVDFRFENSYVASSDNGAWIGATARSVKIIGSHFVNIAHDAIVTDTASKYWNIQANTFGQIGTTANNTYDVLKVGANSANFTFQGNTLNNVSYGITAKYGVEIPNGTSGSFVVSNNDLSGIGTSVIQTGTLGDDFTITNNHGASNIVSLSGGLSVIRSAGSTTISFNPATGKGTFNGGLDANSIGLAHAGPISGATTVVMAGALSGATTGDFSGAVTMGSVKAGASGSVISDTRELLQSVHGCGTTTTCANTANGSYREVFGTVTLSTGAATLASITAFASTASFGCTCTDQTSAAACKAVPASATSVTFAGTGSDVLFYRCVGN
jgi:hypothetical protein